MSTSRYVGWDGNHDYPLCPFLWNEQYRGWAYQESLSSPRRSESIHKANDAETSCSIEGNTSESKVMSVGGSLADWVVKGVARVSACRLGRVCGGNRSIYRQGTPNFE